MKTAAGLGHCNPVEKCRGEKERSAARVLTQQRPGQSLNSAKFSFASMLDEDPLTSLVLASVRAKKGQPAPVTAQLKRQTLFLFCTTFQKL